MKLFACRILILLFTFYTHAATSVASQTKNPNFVIVMVDDLDKVISEAYYREILPFTMSLADEGVSFKNAFITTPTCCPSRSSTLSGNYSHNTNVFGNRGPHGGRKRFAPSENETLATVLYGLGYRTFIAGKYLNGTTVYNAGKSNQKIPAIPQGWTDGAVWASEKKVKNYSSYDYTVLNWTGGKSVKMNSEWIAETRVEIRGHKPEDYSTDVLFAKARNFILQTPADKPFIAYLAPACPHSPITPAPRHIDKTHDLFPNNSFPSNRPNFFNRESTEDKSNWIVKSWGTRNLINAIGGLGLRIMGADSGTAMIGTSFLNVDWHNRMGSMFACDEGVELVVDTLKETDRWDDTIFIFMSDNGYMMGSHGLLAKTVPYEEAIRVPLIVTGGRNLNLHQPNVINDYVLNIDLAPTIYDFVGVNDFIETDGLSFKDSLYDNSRQQRYQFLVEYLGNGFSKQQTRRRIKRTIDVPNYLAIRKFFPELDKEYVYISWDVPRKKPTDQKFADEELYELQSDPHQLINLLRDQEFINSQQIIIENLKSSLAKLKSCRGINCNNIE